MLTTQTPRRQPLFESSNHPLRGGRSSAGIAARRPCRGCGERSLSESQRFIRPVAEMLRNFGPVRPEGSPRTVSILPSACGYFRILKNPFQWGKKRKADGTTAPLGRWGRLGKGKFLNDWSAAYDDLRPPFITSRRVRSDVLFLTRIRYLEHAGPGAAACSAGAPRIFVRVIASMNFSMVRPCDILAGQLARVRRLGICANPINCFDLRPSAPSLLTLFC